MSTPESLTREFGYRVRQRRLELGWSQEELAAACGLHRTYVGSLERGRRNVTLVNLVRVADALRLDVGRLLWRLSTNGRPAETDPQQPSPQSNAALARRGPQHRCRRQRPEAEPQT